MHTNPENNLLAHWYYSRMEWEDFLKGETRERDGVILLECLGLALLAAVLIYWLSGAGFWVAVFTGLIPGTLYGLSRYLLRLRRFRWKSDSMPEVLITRHRADINGRSTVFHGSTSWIRRAELIEKEGRNMIEITYEWQTRTGYTYDEIRIPVPRGKLREAMEIRDKLLNPE